MRLFPRRVTGELSIMDIIFVLLLSEAASHSMSDFTTIGDGIVVMLTLLGWNFITNYLSYKYPFFEKLMSHSATQIIHNGKILKRNLRSEYISLDELNEHLRIAGIDSVTQVKKGYVESDGKLSFIQYPSQTY